MHTRLKLIFVLLTVFAVSTSAAQADSDKEELQMIALEALMASPSERALPAVIKLLDGDGSDELKESALFVLSQIDHPDASAKLLEIARTGEGEMRLEAIRMIGINGSEEALGGLPDMYAAGDADVREAVLEAFMISGDTQAVYDIAVSTENDEGFAEAVEMLAAMGGREELSKLREERGVSDAMIEAYIISDDAVSLRELALDGSSIEQQAQAIEALGIVDADEAGTLLVEIYRNADSDYIREAALDGLLIGDHDASVMQLYRSSDDLSEKRNLLEALVAMDSDLAMDVIDEALAGDQ